MTKDIIKDLIKQNQESARRIKKLNKKYHPLAKHYDNMTSYYTRLLKDVYGEEV